MATLALQLLVALFALASGLVARSAARSLGGAGRAIPWRLAGSAFVLVGAVGTLHALWAIHAVHAGVGSDSYAGFLRWTPAGNHGRTGVVLALGWLLIAHARGAETRPATVRRTLLGALAAGFVLGAAEGAMREGVHYTVGSVLQLLVVLTFAVALLALAHAAAADWLLWLTLALYALHQALSILWLAVLAAVPAAAAGGPRPWVMQAAALLLWCLILAVALHRRRLARAARPVPALFEPPAGVGLRSIH